MTEAGHLWAVGFDDASAAERVCGEIIKLAERHSLILLDWTIAVRSFDGPFTVDGEPLLQPSPRGRLANFLASLALGASLRKPVRPSMFSPAAPRPRVASATSSFVKSKNSCSRARRPCLLLTERRT